MHTPRVEIRIACDGHWSFYTQSTKGRVVCEAIDIDV